MLVLRNGEEICYKQTGMRSIERNEPITRDTIFRLYSQTKPITATAAMILFERGMLDLMQPVEEILPGFANARVIAQSLDQLNNDIPMEMAGENCDGMQAAEPTIPATRGLVVRDLLTMTSGLIYPDSTNAAGRYSATVFNEINQRLYSDNPMTTVEIANRLDAGPLLFQPGSHWAYGTSADIMGAIIETLSGKRFGDFMRDEILKPLGMHDTDFYVPASKQQRLADVYDNPHYPMLPENAGKPLHEPKTNHLGIEYRGSTDPAFQSGGAGLKSTIDDSPDSRKCCSTAANWTACVLCSRQPYAS